MRKQTGYIYRRGDWWVLRYRGDVIENGRSVRKQLAHQLELVAPEHVRLKRPPKAVEQAAETWLKSKRPRQQTLSGTLGDFVEQVYFPHIERQKRASTVQGYKRRWATQLMARCERIQLADFDATDGQDLLDAIALVSPQLKRSTLLHLRNLLSGIFRHAIVKGNRPAPNPIREVKAPDGPAGKDTHAYTLEEIAAMLARLEDRTAYAIVATAAYTGLRRAELSGLLWENYDGQLINVERSVWQGHVNEPKTPKSKASVPCLPRLAKILDQYRLLCGSPRSGVMFSTGKGTPLSLNNVLNRGILPALNRCAVCREPKHATREHEFKRDDTLPKWYGWHAFRRGLATNLYRLGVDSKVIQKIMRHADVKTTMNIYVKTSNDESVAAMQSLENRLDSPEQARLCADRALGLDVQKSDSVN